MPGLSAQASSVKKGEETAIQNKCKALGESGCFLFCYAYIAGVEEEVIISLYDQLIKSNIIEKDGYIKDAQLLFQFFNIAAIVTKTEDLLKMPKKNPYVGVWQYKAENGKVYEHAVVMVKDDIVYNPLDNSQTIKKGKLKSIRIVEELKF